MIKSVISHPIFVLPRQEIVWEQYFDLFDQGELEKPQTKDLEGLFEYLNLEKVTINFLHFYMKIPLDIYQKPDIPAIAVLRMPVLVLQSQHRQHWICNTFTPPNVTLFPYID